MYGFWQAMLLFLPSETRWTGYLKKVPLFVVSLEYERFHSSLSICSIRSMKFLHENFQFVPKHSFEKLLIPFLASKKWSSKSSQKDCWFWYITLFELKFVENYWFDLIHETFSIKLCPDWGRFKIKIVF